jgi:hypothetical protein
MGHPAIEAKQLLKGDRCRVAHRVTMGHELTSDHLGAGCRPVDQ